MVDVHRTRNDHDEVDIATTSLRLMTTVRRHRMCNEHDAVGIVTATPGRCLRSKPIVSALIPLGLCLLQPPRPLFDSCPLTPSSFSCLLEPLCSSLMFPFLSPPGSMLGRLSKAHALVSTLIHQHQHHITVSIHDRNKSTVSASRRWRDGCSLSGGSPFTS